MFTIKVWFEEWFWNVILSTKCMIKIPIVIHQYNSLMFWYNSLVRQGDPLCIVSFYIVPHKHKYFTHRLHLIVSRALNLTRRKVWQKRFQILFYSLFWTLIIPVVQMTNDKEKIFVQLYFSQYYSMTWTKLILIFWKKMKIENNFIHVTRYVTNIFRATFYLFDSLK